MILEVTNKLVINLKARDWCKLPYHDHPNGCPNYGVSEQCPPKVGIVSDVFDLGKKHWISVAEFNLSEHAEKLKAKHPGWSDKQCRCCLYWQNGVRKTLRKECESFILNKSNHIFTLIPEAMGVNVFLTAKNMGIKINWRAFPIIYKIALIGTAKKCEENIQCSLNLQ